MSQRTKYIVTCVVRSELDPYELRKFVEESLGSFIHNMWSGDLEVVKVKEAIATEQQERKQWA